MRDDGVADTSAADAVWPTRLTGVNVVSNQENRTGAPSGLIVTGRGDAGFEPLWTARDLIVTARQPLDGQMREKTNGRINSAPPNSNLHWGKFVRIFFIA
jgi:hypothetical protein